MKKKKRTNDCKTACMLGLFPYDTDVRVQNYVNPLTKVGFSVDIIGQGKEDYSTTMENGTVVSVFTIGERVKKDKHKIFYLWDYMHFLVLSMFKVARLHFRKKYRFIHVHNPPDFLVFATWIPRLFGAKIILDIHDILPEFYARKFGVDMNSKLTRGLLHLEKASCGFANHVIVANDVWRNTLIKRSVEEKKCTSVINFVDRDLFSPKGRVGSEKKNGCFTIIYHGSCTEHHGLDVAIKAIELLKDRISSLKFLIYGEGYYLETVKNLIVSKGLERLIEMREFVPIVEVPRILNEADIGVVPKKDGLFVGEALSTKLFQYVAMGIPAVVSRTVAEKRYFDEDEVKFFTPDDPEDMARKIYEYYQNPQERAVFAQRALNRMDLDNYTIESSAKVYLGLVDTICRKPLNQSRG